MARILQEELPDREVAVIVGDVPGIDFIPADQAGQFPLQHFIQVLVKGHDAPPPEGYPHVALAQKGGAGTDELLQALLDAIQNRRQYQQIPLLAAALSADALKELRGQIVDPKKLALFIDVDSTALGPKDTFDSAQDGVSGQHFQGKRVELLTELAGREVETSFLTAKNALGDVAAGGVHDDSMRLVVPLSNALEAAGVPPKRIRYDGILGQQKGRHHPAGALVWSRAELPEGRQPFTLLEAAAILQKMLEVVQANPQFVGLEETQPAVLAPPATPPATQTSSQALVTFTANLIGPDGLGALQGTRLPGTTTSGTSFTVVDLTFDPALNAPNPAWVLAAPYLPSSDRIWVIASSADDMTTAGQIANQWPASQVLYLNQHPSFASGLEELVLTLPTGSNLQILSGRPESELRTALRRFTGQVRILASQSLTQILRHLRAGDRFIQTFTTWFNRAQKRWRELVNYL